MGDVLDVHAALGAGDDDRGLRLAVQDDGEIEFAQGGLGDADHDLAHQLALLAGLQRDERLAEHLAGDVLDFGGGLDEMDAAFEAVLERALAASTGVDLRLDDEVGGVERLGDRLGFFRRAGGGAGGRRDAKFLHEFFCLILVDVHCGKGLGR